MSGFRNWLFPLVVLATGLSVQGCAGLLTSAPAQKSMGSLCASAGAAMSALALEGTPAQQNQALQDAAILTPGCSASTPASAVTATVQSAATEILTLAAPYQTAGASK